jgi:hypothetical protein
LLTPREVLEELKEEEWIDVATRAVVFDFVFYSSNEGIFALVTLSVEFTSVSSKYRRGRERREKRRREKGGDRRREERGGGERKENIEREWFLILFVI